MNLSKERTSKKDINKLKTGTKKIPHWKQNCTEVLYSTHQVMLGAGSAPRTEHVTLTLSPALYLFLLLCPLTLGGPSCGGGGGVRTRTADPREEAVANPGAALASQERRPPEAERETERREREVEVEEDTWNKCRGERDNCATHSHFSCYN